MNGCTKTTATGLLVFSLMVIGACATSQPGVTYVGGSYRQLFAATPGEVIEAAKDVVTQMELILISSETTDVGGMLVARTAQDRKVVITAEAQSDDVSRVSILVGTWGDEEISVTILDKIRENL